MAEITIAGILRAGAYSPNHIGNDTAIFNAVADELRKRGCLVNIYSEDQFNKNGVSEGVVLNMCREPESIAKLQQLEDEGRLVINSGYGIENCRRERMTRILLGNGIPHPESIIVNTNENVKPLINQSGFQSCWVKRGDFHAMHKEDVTYCRNADEAQIVLHEYFYRGITKAVINAHMVGDLIKFYGILGSPFFYWFYPFVEGNSMYGLEQIKGRSHGMPFDEEYLKSMCSKAAEELNTIVYGGECIVGENGELHIINFSDWPSFAPCREEAAPHIAKVVLNIVKEHKNKP